MRQLDKENEVEAVKSAVRDLFRAENGPGGDDNEEFVTHPDNTPQSVRDVAERILANDYLPITRGRGQVDLDRNETILKVVNGSSSFRRHVGRATIQVDLFLDDQLAIARSVLPTTDFSVSPPAEASYRNTHVFLKRNSNWNCIAWHVTRIQ
ncbi:MAG: hypothetical protein KJ065_27720 [Anaerolineae bacterium]|nr:hypothetical protein [Anaerolineae bacterium]